jgi:hypothetical protein
MYRNSIAQSGKDETETSSLVWIAIRFRLCIRLPRERFIVRIDADGVIQSRRKSPNTARISSVPELVSFPALVCHPNLSLEVLFIREEELWHDEWAGKLAA